MQTRSRTQRSSNADTSQEAGSSPVAQSSLEKKRLRDRRAQTARRARQDARVQELEDQVKRCKEEHNEDLREEVDKLRIENIELRRRQFAVMSILRDPQTIWGHTAADYWQPPKGVLDRSEASSPTEADEESPFQAEHVWAQLPKFVTNVGQVDLLMPWLLVPAVARAVDNLPNGPDILYGSMSNPLANAIHISTMCARLGSVAEPERLAFGYFMYVQTKWLFEPTRERYERLPVFMRPTELQRQRPHSALISAIMWPVIRDNFIRADLDTEQLITALRVLCPELKPSCHNQMPLLEPDPDSPGQHMIRPQFLEQFTNLQSWSFDWAFVEHYPDLARGVSWTA